MVSAATPYPAAPAVLAAARVAVLESLCASSGMDGHDNARRSLAGLSRLDLLEVATVLAVIAGRHEILLAHDEWLLLADVLGIDP